MERDEISMLVAQNIEALMVQRGLDAAKLARLANLNPTGIYDILKGKSKSPKIETIAKIARGLNVPIAAIFSQVSQDQLRSDILFVFDNLPETERERLIQTGRAWLPADESA